MDLLDRNLRKQGIYWNTLTAACTIDGRELTLLVIELAPEMVAPAET